MPDSELLSQLADRAALQDLLATLARADERGDYELIVSCYTEDSQDDHGRFRGTGREFADYICHKSFSASSRFRHHHQLSLVNESSIHGKYYSRDISSRV